jgi:molybdopterin-guanine dinucleotide biosynthesis protein A
LVVTNTPELYTSLGLPMVGDVFPDGGPLGGLYSGLRAVPGDAALCVASDMPFLSAPLLRHLSARAGEADVIIPEAAGGPQTLHAVYRKACLPAMERRLRAGQLKIVDLLDDLRVLRVSASDIQPFADPDLAFMNLNTPEDLARARALWDRQSAAASLPAPHEDGTAG